MRQQSPSPITRETGPTQPDPAAIAATPVDAEEPEAADRDEAGGDRAWVVFLLAVVAMLALCVVATLVAASRPFP